MDVEPMADRFGFPYFPGRTFKGLLKESLKEVMEIMGYDDSVIESKLSTYFGKEGGEAAATLQFRNLIIPGADQMAQAIGSLKERNLAFQPHRIKTHYTMEVMQTAVESTGVAKSRSLRNYRVVKAGTKFVGEIVSSKDLDDTEQELFTYAFRQLRHAGTRRNRGFGAITVTPIFEPESVGDGKSGSQPELDEQGAFSSVTGVLRVTIKTLSSTILPMLTGDQNTVSSEIYISGTRIRGLVADLCIQTLNDRGNAHLDPKFYNAVLSDQIRFLPACPRGFSPLPLNIHRKKGQTIEKPINVFEVEEGIQTRNVGGIGRLEAGKVIGHQITKQSHFHNSRPDRTAGKSQENTENEVGGIFYYEGIDEGHLFEGYILGPASTIKMIQGLAQTPRTMTMGKSKSTQYGDIELHFQATNALPGSPLDANLSAVYMHCVSPLVLFNEFGHPIPDITTLTNTLKNSLGISGLKNTNVINVAAGFRAQETWNRQWDSRTGKIPSFKEGTVFQLGLEGGLGEAVIEKMREIERMGLGEMRNLGYGWVRFGPPEMEELEATTSGSQHRSIQTLGILTDLLESYEEECLNGSVQRAAFDRAVNGKSVTNHLLGRLEQQLEKFEAESPTGAIKKFGEWVEALGNKQAGNALKRSKVKFDLTQIEEEVTRMLQKTTEGAPMSKEDSARKAKLVIMGWKAYLRMVRIANKKGGSN